MATPYCSNSCCAKGRRLITSFKPSDVSNTRSFLQQSPIDVISFRSTFNQNIESTPLVVSYFKSFFEIMNNGYTVTFSHSKCIDTSKTPTIKGGPLDPSHLYILSEFHFHWGESSQYGSEHFVDADAFSAEIHLVHWNSSIYPNVQAASSAAEGLCVMSVFLTSVSNTTESSYLQSQIQPYIQKALEPENSFQSESLEFRELLPTEIDKYFTYSGSLTTPPYTENVKWIIFKEPIEVNESFFDSLRSLKRGSGDEQILNNFRNIMPVNRRIVYRSFY